MKTVFDPTNFPRFTQLLPRYHSLPMRLLTLWVGMLGLSAGLVQSVELASQIGHPGLYSKSANGDSMLPILCPDGRFIAFASTADNLCTVWGTNRIRSLIPPAMNVYLRDRQDGRTTLVSVNYPGTGVGNDNSWPVAVSTNGHFVLFESAASDLVEEDTNQANDIFLRDVVGGKTTVISVSTNGAPGDGTSRDPCMTSDARLIAFVSEASDLVADDTNSLPDVFVRDLTTGKTLLASVGAQSTNPNFASGSSEAPTISADGHYLAFYSTATNLVPGISTAGEIYLRDLLEGKTLIASLGARAEMFAITGLSNNLASFNHVLSSDGRVLAYEAATKSASWGLILRYDLAAQTTTTVATNASVPVAALEDIHNLDITTDGRFIAYVAASNYLSATTTSILRWESETASTVLVSGNSQSAVPAGSDSDSPELSEDGRYVVFISNADLTGTNGTEDYHVFLRDTESASTTLIDAAPGGNVVQGITPAASPRISANGRYVAFESAAPGLSENDRNRSFDVFMRDAQSSPIELISAALPTLESLSPNGSSSLTSFSLSASGQYLAFTSEADNLVDKDTNLCPDIFVRNLLSKSNILVSVSTNGVSPGNGVSTDPAITADGRYVAFSSFANDLVPGDTNGFMDVFVRDLQTGSTRLTSITSDGARLGNGDSYSPILSSDGRFLLFRSRARNMVSGLSVLALNGNLFLRDLQIGTNYALTTSGVSEERASPDCRRVAYTTRPGSAPGALYIWDALTASRVYTNTSVISAPSISPDGQQVAYWLGSTPSLQLTQIADLSSSIVATSSQPYAPKAARFSGDGRFLVFPLRQGDITQVFLYDTRNSTQNLVSGSYDAAGAGNANSDSAEISGDGRFVTYRSSASNLVPLDSNNTPDVFLYDTISGTTILLSVNQQGTSTADNRSLRPLFSADSRALAFQSWATDLAAGDINHFSDIFSWTLYASGIIPEFSARLLVGKPGTGNVITWPVVPGKTYSVQFKNSVGDPGWQEAGHGVIVGNQGWFQDVAGPAQRFYRVVAY